MDYFKVMSVVPYAVPWSHQNIFNICDVEGVGFVMCLCIYTYI